MFSLDRRDGRSELMESGGLECLQLFGAETGPLFEVLERKMKRAAANPRNGAGAPAARRLLSHGRSIDGI